MIAGKTRRGVPDAIGHCASQVCIGRAGPRQRAEERFTPEPHGRVSEAAIPGDTRVNDPGLGLLSVPDRPWI